MKVRFNLGKGIWAAFMSLGLLALLLVGCSDFGAPTASMSSSENNGLWNPQPGDEIGGQAIPLLDEDYWENEYGNTVNPWLATPVPVMIGPEGGIVTCGRHRLIIPAGAVRRATPITMGYGSATAVAVDCGPSPFTFNCPVILELSYAGTQYDNSRGNAIGDPSLLRVFYMPPDWDGDHEDLEELESQVNEATLTVSGQTDHFSRYIIG